MRLNQFSSPQGATFVRLYVGLLCFGLAITSVTSDVNAAAIQLQSGNSIATFVVDPADAGSVADMGLTSWQVDGIEHMNQQWFWIRTASDTREYAVGNGELAFVSSTASDEDGQPGNEFLTNVYADTTGPETYDVQMVYTLTGGSANSNTSDLVEIITIFNTGANDLELDFFQYVDFDLNQTPNNDSIVINGATHDTARQTDPLTELSETVVGPPPSHWMATDISTTSIFDMLEDNSATTLSDASGPFVEKNAAWAFQWDYSGLNKIAPGESVRISKNKNIRSGIVPEPSSCLLALMAFVGLLGFGRRKKS